MIPDVSASASAIPQPRRAEYLRGLIVLIVIAVVGLFIIKWTPYYHRIHLP